MRVKLLIFLVIVMLCVSLSAKSYYARDYYSKINVLENGDLKITERFQYQFKGGPFTWVKREISDKYTDGLELVSASYYYKHEKTELENEERSGGNLHVRWDFEPVSDDIVEFELIYIARSACYEAENGQIVRWRPLPNEHDFRIDRARIDMYLPKYVEEVNILKSGDKKVIAGKAGKHIWWERDNIKEDQSFVTKISLPAGTLNIVQPQWQQNREKVSRYNGVFLWLGIIAIAGLILVIVILVINENKLKALYRPSEIPSDLLEMHPALVAKIINGFDGSTVPVAAMFFRLLKQNFVTLIKTGKKNYEFELSDAKPEDELDLYFYEELAEKVSEGKTNLKKLFNSLDRFKTRFSKILNQWHEDNDYASYSGRRKQNKQVIFIIFSLLIMVILLIVGLIQLENGVVITLMASFLFWYIGLYAILSISKTQTYTPGGYHLKYSWELWKKELNRELKEKRLNPEKEEFDRIFPYVMITGKAERYMDYFKKSGIDISDSVILRHFESLDEFYGFMVWYIATSNAAGASGAGGAAGGASGGGGSASAG